MARHSAPSSPPAAGKAAFPPRRAADSRFWRDKNYIFGRFSFSGQYPAAYAREFYSPNQYYCLKSGARPAAGGGESRSRFCPSLLRYCLRPWVKARAAAKDRRSGLNVYFQLAAKTALPPAAKEKNGAAAPP